MGQIQEFCVNARPKCKTHVFLLNIHLSMRKVADTYDICSASPTHKMSWKHLDPRFNMFQARVFAKVVVLAAQEIVNT